MSLVLLCAVVAGTYYFFSRYDHKSVQAAPIAAIPPQTVIALGSADIEASLRKLKDFSLIESLNTDSAFSLLKSELLAITGQMAGGAVSSLKGILCLSRVSSDELGYLFISSESDYSDLVEELDFDADGIVEWPSNVGDLYIGQYGSVICVSMHLGLVEGAIGNIKDERVPLFRNEVLMKSEYVLVDYSSLTWLLPTYVDLEKLDLDGQLASVQGLALYDFQSSEDGIRFLGSLKPNSIESSLNPAYYAEPAKITVFNSLPFNVPFFSTHVGFSADQQLLMASDDSLLKLEIDVFNSAYKVDLAQDFGEYLGNEYSYALGTAYDHRFSQSDYLMVKLKDVNGLLPFLKSLDSSYDGSTDTLEIGKLASGEFVEWVFEEGGNWRECFFSILDYNLVIAGKPGIIEGIYQAQQSGQSFADTRQFAEMKDWIEEKTNVLVYVNPRLSYMVPNAILKDRANQFYHKHLAILKSMDAFCLRLVRSGDRFFSQVFLHQSPVEPQEKTLVHWSSDLGAKVNYGPYLVTNYISKEKEIIAGTEDGKIHLLGRNGGQKWSYSLESPIAASPFEIDVYKNDKIQYLLSNQSQLHLVDRKGNPVSGYPIKVAGTLTGKLSVFDLEGEKDYHLIVPCSGKKMFMYEADGKPKNGWNPKMLSSNVTAGVQYFNKAGINYYIANDCKGRIYVWNEAGEDVVEPIETNSRIVSNLTIGFRPELEDCKVLAFDSTGNLLITNLKGETKKTLIDKSLHSATAMWLDMNDDGIKELMIHKGSKVKVIRQNGTLLLSILLEDAARKVQVLQDGDDKPYLAVTLPGSVVFYNMAGEVVNRVQIENGTGVLAVDDFTDDNALDLIISSGAEVKLIKNIF